MALSRDNRVKTNRVMLIVIADNNKMNSSNVLLFMLEWMNRIVYLSKNPK